jgi:hypothetical protein
VLTFCLLSAACIYNQLVFIYLFRFFFMVLVRNTDNNVLVFKTSEGLI